MARCSALLLAAFVLCGFQFKTDGLFQTDGLFTVGVVSAGSSGICTDGVDCYCDTVSDGLSLFCEDYEHPGFYEQGSSDWTAGGSNRGVLSRWTVLYGNGADGALHQYLDGDPYIGTRCANGPGSGGSPFGCTGNREYCSAAQSAATTHGAADCWGPYPGNDANIDMQRSGDFDAEVPTLSLSGGKGVTADVGYNETHFAARIPVGETNGFLGAKYFGTEVTEIGYTVMVAYATNVVSSLVLNTNWKQEEATTEPPFYEYLALGYSTSNPGSLNVFPFLPFKYRNTALSEASCDAAVDAATVIGNAECDPNYLTFWPVHGTGVGQYSQSTDWPFGVWGCVRHHIKGMGTSDVEIKTWFNEELILHIDGLDGSYLRAQSYDHLVFGYYANANAGAGGGPTTEVSYTYRDNWRMRTGAPVSCAEIGFD